MKTGPPNEPPRDARLDENDPVWRLLARSPRAEPEAWFAARALARCRREGLSVESSARFAMLARAWRWALGGVLAFSMALAFVTTQVHSHSKKVDKQQKVQRAFELMASIDTDSDSSPPSSSPWQDTSL